MNLIIKSTNYTLTEEARDRIEKKLGAVERLLGDEPEVLLETEVEAMSSGQIDGARYRAEANLNIGGQLYRATARSSTLDGAIEKVRHELEGELRASHGKTRKLMKRGGSFFKDMLRGWR